MPSGSGGQTPQGSGQLRSPYCSVGTVLTEVNLLGVLRTLAVLPLLQCVRRKLREVKGGAEGRSLVVPGGGGEDEDGEKGLTEAAPTGLNRLSQNGLNQNGYSLSLCLSLSLSLSTRQEEQGGPALPPARRAGAHLRFIAGFNPLSISRKGAQLYEKTERLTSGSVCLSLSLSLSLSLLSFHFTSLLFISFHFTSLFTSLFHFTFFTSLFQFTFSLHSSLHFEAWKSHPCSGALWGESENQPISRVSSLSPRHRGLSRAPGLQAHSCCWALWGGGKNGLRSPEKRALSLSLPVSLPSFPPYLLPSFVPAATCLRVQTRAEAPPSLFCLVGKRLSGFLSDIRSKGLFGRRCAVVASARPRTLQSLVPTTTAPPC